MSLLASTEHPNTAVQLPGPVTSTDSGIDGGYDALHLQSPQNTLAFNDQTTLVGYGSITNPARELIWAPKAEPWVVQEYSAIVVCDPPQHTPVPEPGSAMLGLLGALVIAVALLRRGRQARAK